MSNSAAIEFMRRLSFWCGRRSRSSVSGSGSGLGEGVGDSIVEGCCFIFVVIFGSRVHEQFVIFQHFFALLDSEVYVLIACLLAQERAGRKLVSYIYCGYAPKR